MLKEALLQILYAFLGSYGFALMFNQKPLSRALPASLGGAVSWAVYLVCADRGASVFFCAFAGGLVACLYSELLARLLKAPTTVFCTAAVIPLIPGGSLYHTMRNAISGDSAQFREFGSATLYTSLGIAVGIALVTAAFHIFTSPGRRRKTQVKK